MYSQGSNHWLLLNMTGMTPIIVYKGKQGSLFSQAHVDTLRVGWEMQNVSEINLQLPNFRGQA